MQYLIRYLKHLKSRTAEPQFTDQNVAVLKLERQTGPQASCPPGESRLRSSPPYKGGVAAALSGRGGSLNSGTEQAEISSGGRGYLIPMPSHSPLSTLDSRLTATPFLGFTYLGTSTEHDQNRNYLAETLALITGNPQKRPTVRPLSTTQALTAGIINGTYQKYLRGE